MAHYLTFKAVALSFRCRMAISPSILCIGVSLAYEGQCIAFDDGFFFFFSKKILLSLVIKFYKRVMYKPL